MKYFLFDIGNVLTDFDFPRLLEIFSQEGGQPLAPHTEHDQHWYDQIEKGLISDQEYVGYLNETKGLSWSIEHLTSAWQEIFSINETGRHLFNRAVDSGVAVYTLSNIAQYHVDAIERNWSGFFDDATGLFMSYKMGVRKPDPNIYRMALEELGVSGEQCFFIDDLADNVAAAREWGIDAYQFIPDNYMEIEHRAHEFFGW